MKCRGCRQPGPVGVLDLGWHRLPDFTGPGVPYPPQGAPLKLMLCRGCGLLQLSETVPRSLLYHDRYGFVSGVNEAIRADLEDVAKCALGWHLDSGCPRLPERWLDIACNDGTLLSYVPAGIHCTGVDPLAHLAPLARRYAERVISGYFNGSRFRDGEFDIITSVSMFYDLDRPDRFAQNVARILDPDGVWVIQQNYAADMIANNAVDNVCLPPEDPVITERGLMPIGKIKVGDRVLTHTGAYQPVREVLLRDYQGDLIELRGYGFGHTLRVTPGHPVFTERGWLRADEVQTGVAVGRAIPQPDVKPPREFGKTLAAVAGYYLAEGTVGVHGAAVAFTFGTSEAEEELAEHCQSLIRELGIGASLHQARTTTIVQTYGWLAPFLQEHFGKGAAGKRIPAWSMSQEAAEELLRCYMAGDGYRYRGDYLRSSTVSRQLALDVQMLANRLGYKASICRQERPTTCVIEGRLVRQQPLWDVLVHQAPVNRQKVWIENGAQWGRIREIRRVAYAGQVVNLEVEGDRSYSTPAMTVQNCHEHVTYFTAGALMPLLLRAGLQIADVQYSAVNGGCIRTLVTHRGACEPRQSVQSAVDWEHAHRLDAPDTWRQWGEDVRGELARTRRFLEDARTTGERVLLYGASTRGGTFLQMINAGPGLLPYAVERNPDKVGKVMAATGIPIISEEEMRASPPDALLVSPWFFRDVFVQREAEYLRNGGAMVFPLPRFEVVRG